MRKQKREKVEGYTAEELARYTRLLRKVLRIHDRRTFNLLELIAPLQQLFPKFRTRVVCDDDMPNAEARAYPASWIIKYRRGIEDGLLRGSFRSRWTILHELGHVLLAHSGRPYRRISPGNGESRIEQEAHLFAAEFLAPADLIKQYRSSEEISRAFQISIDAAARRLDETRARERQKRFGAHQRTALPNRTIVFEDHAALICTKALDALKATRLPVECYAGNALGAALLASRASELLLDAYESLRKIGASDHCVQAAMLAAAICAVRPIREIGALGDDSKEVIDINCRLALSVAALIMNLEPDIATRVDHCSSVLRSYESTYLQPLMQFGSKLLDGHPVESLQLYDRPSYALYNRGDDTSWCEIHALDELIELMRLIKIQAG